MGEFSNPQDYELWIGRWSARLAPIFIDFINLPKGGRFLDVGSGTGTLAAAVVAAVEDTEVVGIEPAESYLRYSQTRFSDDHLSFQQGNAMAIPFADKEFDGTLSLLILQELSDAPKAIREMRRVTRVGGCVAGSQWNFEDGMPMLALFWDAVVEVMDTQSAREAATECMVVSYPNGEALTGLWEQAGLVEVETQLQEVQMTFESFDDYWKPFLSGVTKTASYAQKLSEEQKNALKERLWDLTIGGEKDRSFALTTQAWAVKGVRRE